MKKLIGITLLFSISLLSIAQIKVVPITDTILQLKKNAPVYFLPQKIVSVRVDVETRHFIPGPFSKFAEKYLLIDDAPIVETSISDIVGVEFNEISVVDPSAGYFILKNEADIQFDKRGVIAVYNGRKAKKNLIIEDNEIGYLNLPDYFDQDQIIFTDYSVKRNFTGITDTTYKVIELDSVFQKIPVYNTVITSKDFEQKAEEAANFIIKLRKRRFKLQTAQFDDQKPPKDLKEIIKQLDELEKQYLELFLGKEIVNKNTFYAVYKPKADKIDDKVLLFYISDESGISKDETPDSEPVYLKTHNCGVMSELTAFYNRQEDLNEKEKAKGLFYRIPGHGSFVVELDGHEYAKQVFTIPQYCIINNLPAKMFKNKHLKILFDIENGSIERISNE